MFGLKLFTFQMVVHDMIQFMKIMLLSAFGFICLYGMTPCLVYIYLQDDDVVSALFNPAMCSHDGLWPRVEPVCNVRHLSKCSLQCNTFFEYLMASVKNLNDLSYSGHQVVQAGTGRHQLRRN